jgi:hypothetical protein
MVPMEPTAPVAVVVVRRAGSTILERRLTTSPQAAEGVVPEVVAARRARVVLVPAVRSRCSFTLVRRRHRRRPILCFGRIVCAAIWVVAAVTAARVVRVARVDSALQVELYRARSLPRSVW